jgi:hypothetical protein
MGQDMLMDFCCGHPGAKSYAKKENIVRSPGLIFPGLEKRKNKMYLAKANSFNITFMPLASNVYGSMSVTFRSVFTKAAEMISEIASIPLHQVAKHWIQRISFAIYNPTVKHSLTNESSSTEPIIELKITVRSANMCD